jgi:dihydrofolate synthase/folylpolyglutamate synthase
MRTTKQKNPKERTAATFEEALSQASSFGIRPGLETMQALMECLDNPQDRLQVVHVAGTNGKGSVCAMLESVFRTAGCKTGLYTSPHLLEYGERFRINGENAGEERLRRLLEQVLRAADQIESKLGCRPTEFELLTAMGFLYFEQEKVDVLILEVGLGGRLDATNLVRRPRLTVITNVTMDHENFLGNDLRGIAGEKAGIIKPGVSLVCAAEDPLIQEVIREQFDQTQKGEKQARLHWVHSECRWQLLSQGFLNQQVALQTPFHRYETIDLPLIGPHQCINLATAVLALELLQQEFPKLGPAAVEAGVRSVSWPGRLEVVRQRPLVVLDGAHNPDGMRRLAQWLIGMRPSFDRVILVIGMLADKDRQSAASQLEPLVDRIFITRPPSDRAVRWEDMGTVFRQTDPGRITYIEACNQALAAAVKEAGPRDLVLAAGSLYLIGALKREIKATAGPMSGERTIFDR